MTELPEDFVVSAITIPDAVDIETVARRLLPRGWNRVSGSKAAKEFGKRWVKDARSAVLSVPSSIVANERLFVLNPAHPDFSQIRFGKPEPHVFDARLK